MTCVGILHYFGIEFPETDITDFFVDSIATALKTDLKYCCYGKRRIVAQDGTIILPFIKCDPKNQAKGSIFVKEGHFCENNDHADDIYEVEDLDSLSPTILSQTFLKLYDDYVKERE